ncbi:transposase [Sphaerisporangium corydalis]|uniref:Transposase n=1 Tax=Sphaerisporangium corydalis TaxID=1441875 RepID=A0ABV9EJY8_9ACTN
MIERHFVVCRARESTLTAWRAVRQGPSVAARVNDLREIVNAILYMCRTGIAWEYLPHDCPSHKTVMTTTPNMSRQDDPEVP